MPGKTIAEPQFPGDDGAADPAASAALAAYAAGQGSEHDALTALAGCRLLVPVVAVLAEEETPPDGGLRREKTSEMALPTLIGADGRRAVLAFTGLDALTRWRPDARPVPVPAAQVWAAGADEADAVVIDVAGPVPLAVDGARLEALAQGRPVPLPHEDADLLAGARAVAAADPEVAAVRLLPGRDGGDLTVEVTLAPGVDPGWQHPAGPGPGGAAPGARPRARWRRARRAADAAGQTEPGETGRPAAPGEPALDVTAAVQRIADGIAAASGGRLRRGIAVTIVAG